MIELKEWLTRLPFDDKPWLVLGKGPTFGRRNDFELSGYHLLSLNHVVRELPVAIAHIIDIDVVVACADALLNNCRYLVMPRHPHIDHKADSDRPLESFFQQIPVLRTLDEQGRLIWYNLRNNKKSPLVGVDSVLCARYFSSEAALHLLGLMGVTEVRTLGIDGGTNYGAAFSDLADQTRLANGQPSFDLQFSELDKIVAQFGMDFQRLITPMQVFVGVDESQMVPTRVLEYSIRKHTPMPVQVTPMLNVPVPMPRDPRNRPRTGFSFCRFLIPGLCGYRGRALYVDSDMQVFTDLEALWKIPFGEKKVLCTYQKEPPEAWRNPHTNFKPGRQMSVMMLDNTRLPWRIDDIVRGLDEGAYTYEQLMFDLCLVKPDEIGDDLPPEWNCLEHYEDGHSKLLHYTVVDTQPWRNDRNPLGEVWMKCYHEAVAAGAVTYEEVALGVQRGWLKRSLLEAFPDRAPLETADSATKAGQVLRPMAQSWTGRLRQAVRSLLGGSDTRAGSSR